MIVKIKFILAKSRCNGREPTGQCFKPAREPRALPRSSFAIDNPGSHVARSSFSRPASSVRLALKPSSAELQSPSKDPCRRYRQMNTVRNRCRSGMFLLRTSIQCSIAHRLRVHNAHDNGDGREGDRRNRHSHRGTARGHICLDRSEHDFQARRQLERSRSQTPVPAQQDNEWN